MATRFEIVLHGDNPVRLRAAGEEALDEVERLDRKLSLYRADSEIAQVNAVAFARPVRVSAETFRLLERAHHLWQETGGAFDITIAPLLRAWGFLGGSGSMPDPAAVTDARSRVGMNLVELDSPHCAVRFRREGVMLDLGAIGKGCAVEKAAELLRDAGVTSALIHGGTSSVYALGTQPQGEPWKVAIEFPSASSREEPGRATLPRSPVSAPRNASAPEETPTICDREAVRGTDSVPSQQGAAAAKPVGTRCTASRSSPERRGTGCNASLPGLVPWPRHPAEILAIVPLRDESLSVSAVWGKSFEVGGTTYGHIIDPRTGRPAAGALLAAVVLPSATEGDAFSTALLIAGCAGHDAINRLRAGMRSLVVQRGADRLEVRATGIELRQESDEHSL